MNLRYRPEKEEIAKINRELKVRVMETGSRNHYDDGPSPTGLARCACRLLLADRGLLARHIANANEADEARGDGRQKYGLIKIGDCKVTVRFDFDGNLVIRAHGPRGIPVKFATDADSLSIAP